nr:uncharacterized protein LOC126548244 isoform X1 [Dermacentor andersoni]
MASCLIPPQRLLFLKGLFISGSDEVCNTHGQSVWSLSISLFKSPRCEEKRVRVSWESWWLDARHPRACPCVGDVTECMLDGGAHSMEAIHGGHGTRQLQTRTLPSPVLLHRMYPESCCRETATFEHILWDCSKHPSEANSGRIPPQRRPRKTTPGHPAGHQGAGYAGAWQAGNGERGSSQSTRQDDDIGHI